MVWCTCPTRCKGGREISPRTRTIHEKKYQEKERQRLLQQHFPERPPPPPNPPRKRRHYADAGNTPGTRRKKTRMDNEQGNGTQTRLVRELTPSSTLVEIENMGCSLNLAMTKSLLRTHEMVIGTNKVRYLYLCISIVRLHQCERQVGRVALVTARKPQPQPSIPRLILYPTTSRLPAPRSLPLPTTTPVARTRNLIYPTSPGMRMASGQETLSYSKPTDSLHILTHSRIPLQRLKRSGMPRLTSSSMRMTFPASGTRLRRSSISTTDTSAGPWTCTSST